MIRIYIKQRGKDHGMVFKSKTSIQGDQVRILGWINFLVPGYITKEEWAKSTQLISDKFGFEIKESYINGRSKVGRNTPYFSWELVIKGSKKKAKPAYTRQDIKRH